MKQEKIYLQTLGKKIAAAAQCKEPYKQSAIDSIEEMQKLLPHGSGIDGSIFFDLTKSNSDKIVIFLEFHHLNEGGFYDGWTSHNITITPSFVNGFDMRISGQNKNQIKDYLIDVFYDLFTIEEENTFTTKVYKFDALTDEGKESALDNLRDINVDHEWWDYIYDEAKEYGLIIESFDLERNRHAKGKFENMGIDVARNIVSNHGETCETFKTSSAYISEFEALDKRLKDEQAKEDNEEDNQVYEVEKEIQEGEEEYLKSILEDYSIILQNSYEDLISDERIIETIEANDYTFTIDGKLQNL